MAGRRRLPGAYRDDGGLVRPRDRRVRASALQQEGRQLVPLEHELVHLQRGDVLRGVLRRAVLHPQPVGAGPGGRHDRPHPVARIRAAMAHGGPVHQGAVLADGGHRHPAPEHDHPADVRRHAHRGAPRAQGRAPQPALHLAVRDHRAGLHLPGLPGVRVPPRLHRVQPEAHDGRLRLDVLHADGLPRPARDHRRDHAVGDARPHAAVRPLPCARRGRVRPASRPARTAAARRRRRSASTTPPPRTRNGAGGRNGP